MRIASTKKRTQSTVWIKQPVRTAPRIIAIITNKCENFNLILQVGYFILNGILFSLLILYSKICLESSWEIQFLINLLQFHLKLQLQKTRRKNNLEINQKPAKHAVHVLTPKEFVMNGMYMIINVVTHV